jgi:hypothetical protein
MRKSAPPDVARRQAMGMHAAPHLVFEQTAGDEHVRLQRCRRTALFDQQVGEGHRTVEVDHRSSRDRSSSARSCSRDITSGGAGGGSPGGSDAGVTSPWRTASARTASTNPTASTCLRGGQLRHNAIPIRDQHCLARRRKPDVLAEPVIEGLDPDRAHGIGVATRGYFAKRWNWRQNPIPRELNRCSAPKTRPERTGRPEPPLEVVR